MIRPIVIGTHEYEWTVDVFACLFDKYWHRQDITYIGDHLVGTLHDCMTFMQVPCRSEGIWRWKYWFGNGLRSIFEKYIDDLIVLFLPDQWLTATVDVERVESLGRYMMEYPNIIRGSLVVSQSMYKYGHVVSEWECNEIWRMPITNSCAAFEGGLTFCPSIWNPRVTLDIIEPTWTIWQCEVLGTDKMRDVRTDLYSIGIRPAPLHIAHALYHAQERTVHLSSIQEEDRPMVLQYIPQGWSVI